MEEILPVTHNQPEYTVSEIAGALKNTVERQFGYVRVRGEISGWKGPHANGHAYFRLKDDNAVLDAICWRGSLSKIGCKPEEGMEVVATGRLTTYPGKSSYQIIIERMEPAGVGALMALLEKRKATLLKEGLFAPERKKPLPLYPRVIGVITSPTGAVIRDILHRIMDRHPLHVIVWPVAVQGEGAAENVAEAIIGFNEWPMEHRPDLLIVARGGGSVEDLWAFNEEIVVRAAGNSKIPLISAIGHETDTTLIDLVSDRRAPTPTAAAEMAVLVKMDIIAGINDFHNRMVGGISRILSETSQRLRAAGAGLLHPRQILENSTQKLDIFSERLENALKINFEKKHEKFLGLQKLLRPQALLKDFDQYGKALHNAMLRLVNAGLMRLEKENLKIANIAKLMESYHYEKVLARGFALVRSAEGNLITSAGKASGQMQIQFKDGRVDVSGGGKTLVRQAKKTTGGDQESLF